jgi:hypothetical protein
MCQSEKLGRVRGCWELLILHLDLLFDTTLIIAHVLPNQCALVVLIDTLVNMCLIGMGAISAAGFVLPPLLVFSGDRDPEQFTQDQLRRLVGAPPGTAIIVSSSGWVDVTSFHQVIHIPYAFIRLYSFTFIHSNILCNVIVVDHSGSTGSFNQLALHPIIPPCCTLTTTIPDSPLPPCTMLHLKDSISSCYQLIQPFLPSPLIVVYMVYSSKN